MNRFDGLRPDRVRGDAPLVRSGPPAPPVSDSGGRDTADREGAIGQEEAIEAVHWETLGLLVGMMILVGILKESGIFGYLAIKSAQAAGGVRGSS